MALPVRATSSGGVCAASSRRLVPRVGNVPSERDLLARVVLLAMTAVHEDLGDGWQYCELLSTGAPVCSLSSATTKAFA